MYPAYLLCGDCGNVVPFEEGTTVDNSRLTLTSDDNGEVVLDIVDDETFMCSVCVDRHNSHFPIEGEPQ